MSVSRFTLNNLPKGTLSKVPFRVMKDAILGKDYTLTASFIPANTSRKLNKAYRGIDAPTDILSFPLSPHEGEIYINLPEARREAKKFEREFVNFIGFLFIHGLVHLSGLDHGREMEKLEKKYRLQFGI